MQQTECRRKGGDIRWGHCILYVCVCVREREGGVGLVQQIESKRKRGDTRWSHCILCVREREQGCGVSVCGGLGLVQ